LPLSSPTNFPARFKKLRLFILDPYDLVLSKLSRNVARDREDVAYPVRTQTAEAGIVELATGPLGISGGSGRH
jgi:uncharacterized nucleotidyltransferase DUF6036